MSLRGHFFNALVILYTRTITIRLPRRKLDRHVNVTQSLGLGFQHAAEENHPGYLPEEIGVVVDPLHSTKELLQRLFGRGACDPLGRCRRGKGPSRLAYLPRGAAGGFQLSQSPAQTRTQTPEDPTHQERGVLPNRPFRIDAHSFQHRPTLPALATALSANIGSYRGGCGCVRAALRCPPFPTPCCLFLQDTLRRTCPDGRQR